MKRKTKQKKRNWKGGNKRAKRALARNKRLIEATYAGTPAGSYESKY